VIYADPDCATPFEMPPGATLRPRPGAMEVTVDGEAFLLRCIDGQWVRQKLEQQPTR